MEFTVFFEEARCSGNLNFKVPDTENSIFLIGRNDIVNELPTIVIIYVFFKCILCLCVLDFPIPLKDVLVHFWLVWFTCQGSTRTSSKLPDTLMVDDIS